MKLQAHKKIWKNINIEYASEKEKWEGLSFLYQPGVGVWDSNPKEYGLLSFFSVFAFLCFTQLFLTSSLNLTPFLLFVHTSQKPPTKPQGLFFFGRRSHKV